MLASVWGESENNRKAKFYSFTTNGRKQLRVATDQWSQVSKAIGSVLKTQPGEV